MCDKRDIIGDLPARFAIYDTESDQFVTSAWPEKWIHKIWRMWERNHGSKGMARFEIRERYYGNEKPDYNTVVLVIDRETNKTVIFYHWDNRKYALAFDPLKYFFIKYTLPSGEITDSLNRFDMKKWDGKGELVPYEKI